MLIQPVQPPCSTAAAHRWDRWIPYVTQRIRFVISRTVSRCSWFLRKRGVTIIFPWCLRICGRICRALLLAHRTYDLDHGLQVLLLHFQTKPIHPHWPDRRALRDSRMETLQNIRVCWLLPSVTANLCFVKLVANVGGITGMDKEQVYVVAFLLLDTNSRCDAKCHQVAYYSNSSAGSNSTSQSGQDGSRWTSCCQQGMCRHTC